MKVVACLPQDALQIVERQAHALGLPAPGAVRSAEAFAEALGGLAEVQAALEGLATAGAEDLLLLDGSLRGLPERRQAWADRVREAAVRRGVPVVGIAKRSGLAQGGVPLIPRIEAAVDHPGPWAVPVPEREDVWVVRLHPRAPFCFRADGAARDLPRLVPLCRDAAYLGYPYPLALAHNRVAITAARARDEAEALRDAVAAAGGSVRWLQDFHDVLDRNVPG